MIDNENDPQQEAMDPATEEMDGSMDAGTPAATENPVQKGLQLPDDAINLVPVLLEAAKTNEQVKKYIEEELPEQVLKHFNEDWDARKDWIAKRQERLKLWLGDLEEKHEPFKNCANLHVPLLLTRTLRLAFRVHAEIFKPGQPVFSAQASSKVSTDRAELITRHENWQFRKEIPDFPIQVHRALLEFFRDGDCIFDSYRDFERNVNRHEHLSVDEFVYPYTRKSTASDMSDIPRKTKVLYPYKRDLLKMAKMGFYDQGQVDKVVAEDGSHEVEVDQQIKDTVDKFEGMDRLEHVSDAPYYLLEYHGWAQIPDQEEEMPVRAVVDVKTKTVIGLYSRYYDDPQDKPRFEQQSAEFQVHIENVGKFMQIHQMERQVLSSLQQPGVPQDEALAIAQGIQRQSPPMPVRPSWMEDDERGMPKPPEPCKQKVIERFSHGMCIQNPDGSHGLGVGLMLMPHQVAANITKNQFVDQATLANSTTGFMHENFKLDPGVKSVNPGEILRVRGVPPDQIEKAYFQIQPPPANMQLLQASNDEQSHADSISSAPDVLSGEKEGDETFRGQATRVEQAVKQLTVFAANFIACLTQVAKNNALLNSQFLPDDKMMDVADPETQKMIPIRIGRDLYHDDYEVNFSADLSFSSRAAKIAESDDILGMLTKGVPPKLASLILDPKMFSAAVRNCLKARGMYEMLALMPTDEQIDAKVQAMSAPPPGAPGAPPMPGQMPAPNVPTGQPNNAPGTVPPQTGQPVGVPTEAAPGR